MALIYVTGASGAGKSTVCAELRRRGYPAFGSTEDELRRVLAWYSTVDADNLRFGAYIIDASAPVAEVVDHVLAELGLGPRLADRDADS
ncbi:MAG: hypothetical protein QOF10_6490 [Kribbellaceae bacterium]|nr:hypothetical protein [Kribbellaceae bacterium]